MSLASARKLWRSGEPFIWLTGGALALALIMVAGLIGIILANALGFFWPAAIVRLTLRDGKTLAGSVVERERIPGATGRYRIKLKVANRDLYGADFVWVDEPEITERTRPTDVAVIERTEWGLLIGTITALREGDRVIATGPGLAMSDRERVGDTGIGHPVWGHRRSRRLDYAAWRM